jgi:hypothetical protein
MNNPALSQSVIELMNVVQRDIEAVLIDGISRGLSLKWLDNFSLGLVLLPLLDLILNEVQGTLGCPNFLFHFP